MRNLFCVQLFLSVQVLCESSIIYIICSAKFLFVGLQPIKTRSSSPQCRAGMCPTVLSVCYVESDRSLSVLMLLCIYAPPSVHSWIQGGRCVPAHNLASSSQLVGVWQYEDSTRICLSCDRWSLIHPSFVIQSEYLPLDIQSAPFNPIYMYTKYNNKN